MRRIVLLCTAAVLVGCAKKEATPAADTTAAAAPAPPPALTANDVAGKWHVQIMREGSDSVITEYDMTISADSGVKVMLPKRPVMTPTVSYSGDSMIVDMGPFESVLRKGVQVTTHGVSRLVGGELVGTTIAHYSKGADSVVTLRSKGTKTP